MDKSSSIENKRVSAIKTVLEREGLKQKDLAEMIGIEPQNLSRCMVSGKISDKMCLKIARCFPGYLKDWFLGYEDAMTTAEKFSNALQTTNEESELLHRGFMSFAQLSGFQIDIAPIAGNDTLEKTFQNMKEHCTITRDGKSVTFSVSELNDFENELCDYVEFRLSHIIK